jgi:hypothetical protein
LTSEGGDGIVRAAQANVDVAQAVPGKCVLGIEFDGLLESGEGVIGTV